MRRLLILAGIFFFTSVQSQVVTMSVRHVQQVAAGGQGPEMLTDGDMSSSTNWTESAEWSIAGGVASYDNTAGGTLAQADGDMVSSIAINTDYDLAFDVSNLTGSNAYFWVESSDGGIEYIGQMSISNGPYSLDFTTGGDVGIKGFRIRALDDGAFDIDNISLKEDL